MRLAIITVAMLAMAGPAAAQAERSFQTSQVIPAAPAVVWDAMTSSAGWRRMGVPFVVMDFRVGGIIESNYAPTAKVGDPDNIKNQVVAYVPGRMLALRNVQAPRSFPHPKEFAATATVFELAPAANGETRVTATGVGYGPGKAFDQLLDMFEKGDAWALAKLAESFATGAKPASAETRAIIESFEKH